MKLYDYIQAVIAIKYITKHNSSSLAKGYDPRPSSPTLAD